MRLLFLSEGDPENAAKSGSGTPKSVIDHLRGLGIDVASADVDLHGASKAISAALTFSPSRPRWVARYHLGRLPFSIRSRNAAAALRRQEPPVDAILQYGGTFAPRGSHVPYFLYCDNNVLNAYDVPISWGARLPSQEVKAVVASERRTYGGAAAIFTFSDFVRQSFLRQYGLPEEKVVTVRAGPNFDLSLVPAKRHTTDTSDRPPTVLFVGREFGRKGGPVLIDAFAKARAAVPTARLLIVGPNEMPAEARLDGVEFLGYLRKDDPAGLRRLLAAYAEADVFCFPTRHEPFGIAILEAMFFSLPVLATARWAIPEMVQHGTTGYLVEPEDATTYAQHLIELLRDPARAASMGAEGRRRAHAHFTWARVAERMRDVIASELERR